MNPWKSLLLQILLFLAVAGVLADNITTSICLFQWEGLVEETNPLTNLLIHGWGADVAIALNTWAGIAIAGWIFWLAHHKQRWDAAVALALVVLVRGSAAVHNFLLYLTVN